MENSMNSIGRERALSSNDRTTESQEESGWTKYFEEFLFNNNNNEHSYVSSECFESSSLVSDAASLAAKRSENSERFKGLSVVGKSSKRLSFKKRKTAGALVDDALEDTASSPVNSPKLCDLKKMNPKLQNENIGLSQEKGSTSGQIDERSDLGFTRRDSDCTELKKRGLCLVPLSMVVNYLG